MKTDPTLADFFAVLQSMAGDLARLTALVDQAVNRPLPGPPTPPEDSPDPMIKGTTIPLSLAIQLAERAVGTRRGEHVTPSWLLREIVGVGVRGVYVSDLDPVFTALVASGHVELTSTTTNKAGRTVRYYKAGP